MLNNKTRKPENQRFACAQAFRRLRSSVSQEALKILLAVFMLAVLTGCQILEKEEKVSHFQVASIIGPPIGVVGEPIQFSGMYDTDKEVDQVTFVWESKADGTYGVIRDEERPFASDFSKTFVVTGTKRIVLTIHALDLEPLTVNKEVEIVTREVEKDRILNLLPEDIRGMLP